MSVVNCATFKRRCAKSLSTVICHGDEAKMRFAIAAPVTGGAEIVPGGSIYHPGVLDVRGRRDFSRFDPRPQSPHFSNFGAMSGVV